MLDTVVMAGDWDLDLGHTQPIGAADPGPRGTTWAGAGQVWYDALTGGLVGPRTDFAGFAAATLATAGAHAEAVAAAWDAVGVQ